MKCKTCHHPQRQTIDLALLSRNHTLEFLSRTFGLSISSLHRHRNHLTEKLQRTRQRLHNVRTQGSLLRLSGFLDRVQEGVDQAAADGPPTAVFRGAHVGSRLIHQMHKMEVSLELETVYRLITSPQWASGGSLLPADPQTLAGLYQSVLEDAFFPCPELQLEPAPDLDAEDDDEDDDDFADDTDDDDEDDQDVDDLEEDDDIADEDDEEFDALEEDDDTGADDDDDDRYAALAAALTEDDLASLDALIRVLALDERAALKQAILAWPTLAPYLIRGLADQCLSPAAASAKPAPTKREKSAKLPRKIAPRAKNTKQYKQDSTSGKNAPKNPRVGRENEVHPAVVTCNVDQESAAPAAALTNLSPPGPASLIPDPSPPSAPPAAQASKPASQPLQLGPPLVRRLRPSPCRPLPRHNKAATDVVYPSFTRM